MTFELITCDRAFEGVPQWVHLLPLGKVHARDGRVFMVADPEALISLFEGQSVDLPIDYDHQNDKPKASGPTPAAGWIKELASRKDGIWGRVEWTSRARELIKNREYRYLSPSLRCVKATGEVVKINGAGLVHNPALQLTALASQEENMDGLEGLLQKLAELLGMSPEDGEDAILDALKERMGGEGKPDPAKYVPIEAVEDLMRQRSEEATGVKADRIATKVEKACQDGFISPAMRDWALDLCMTDECSFDGFLSRTVPAFAHLTQVYAQGTPPSAAKSKHSASDEAAMVSSQLGIAPDELI